MLRPSTKPRRANSHRSDAVKRCAPFLQWIRGRECLFHGIGECEGPIEAMHLDFAGDKGMSSKVSDRFAVPACAGHHRRQHTKGWATFLKELGLGRESLLDAAAFLWGRWPGRANWERKLEGGQ